MNLAGWRFLLFALVGATAIVVLASIGVPRQEEVLIDRHTGERTLIVRTVADAIAEARDTGDAVRALAAVRKRREQFPVEPALARLEAVLLAEFGRVPDTHRDAAAIAAERVRAAGAREELRRRVREKLGREALVGLLLDLEADASVARATEELFAPLARWRASDSPSPHRPDELAARTLALLEVEESIEDPRPFLELASAFRAQNRTRARLRWLLRAYGAFPDSAAIRRPLLEAYLEHKRLVEAFHVVGATLRREPKNIQLWRLRAQLAGWLSLPHEEVEAQEVLLPESGDAALRGRLITLYTYIGRPQDAIPHARVLAEGSTDPQVIERPARLALDAGMVDTALAYYDELAKNSDDPAAWREKIVTLAWQDLRVERVILELELLRERYPGGGYGRRLEGVFRRCNMPQRLARRLEERLESEPDNHALERELIGLYAGLGDEARIRAIVQRRMERGEDPRGFFSGLRTYRALKLKRVAERAQAMAASPRLTARDIPFVLERIHPYIAEARFRAVGARLGKRFPGVPEARRFLAESVDHEADPARAAEQLAAAYPGVALYLRTWIDRAAWAGATESEIRAREAWSGTHADDLLNRRKLANLYAGVHRPADAAVHWRHIAGRKGAGSKAALRLIDTLFAAGELDEAMTWLEKRADLPEATLPDRLHVAEQLFGNQLLDRALRFYLAVLDLDPNSAQALLRVGQIRSWTNDPRGAIPFFERRLAVSDGNAAEVRFYLGEAHWSIRDTEAGGRYHARALEELQALEARSIEQDVMVAKMLARFGRVEEAEPIFERVLVAAPDEVDLVLDYADAMASIRRVRKARKLVDRARAREPDRPRGIRLDAKVALLEERYEDSAKLFREALDRFGPDAGTESELGRALELAGEWTPALQAYRRSLALQPDNHDVRHALQRTVDRVAPLLHAAFELRRTGADTQAEMWASATAPLGNERTRVAAAFGLSHFRDGGTDTSETASRLRAAAFHRFARTHTIGGGVDAYAGVEGDTPVGGWLGVLFTKQDPYRLLGLRAHAHMLLEDPVAAVALGGRRSGVSLFLQRDFAGHFWAAVDLGYERLTLEPSASDGRFRGYATLGWRILEGQVDAADRLRIDRAQLPGLVGPNLQPSPLVTRGPLVSAWAAYQTIHLLGDRELAAIVPIGERLDYLTLGARADLHLAPGWGAQVEGYVGAELNESEGLFGFDGAVTWRPSHRTELTCGAGYGRALERAGDVHAFHLRLGFSHRW